MSEQSFSPERRHFLGKFTLTFGGVALSGMSVAGMAPLSLLEVAPAACLVDAAAWPDACGDWTVDDMCSAYPPYSFNTGASQPHSVPFGFDVQGVDRHWMA